VEPPAAAAPSVSVDNGTSAWGKPVDTKSSSSGPTWEEHGRDPPSRGPEAGSSWGGQHKTGRPGVPQGNDGKNNGKKKKILLRFVI